MQDNHLHITLGRGKLIEESCKRQPFTYNHRSPFTYRNPVGYQLPFTYNYRVTIHISKSCIYQLPFTYNYSHHLHIMQDNLLLQGLARNGQQPAIAIGPFQQPYPYQSFPGFGGGAEVAARVH